LRTKLHNILFDRKLFSIDDVKRQRGALFAALQAVLRVDQHTLQTAYEQYAKGDE
jgi:hypothetical protein